MRVLKLLVNGKFIVDMLIHMWVTIDGHLDRHRLFRGFVVTQVHHTKRSPAEDCHWSTAFIKFCIAVITNIDILSHGDHTKECLKALD